MGRGRGAAENHRIRRCDEEADAFSAATTFPAIIVALVLGAIGTVCQIVGPDKLKDMTNEIAKGLPALATASRCSVRSTWTRSHTSHGCWWRCMWAMRCCATCKAG